MLTVQYTSSLARPSYSYYVVKLLAAQVVHAVMFPPVHISQSKIHY